MKLRVRCTKCGFTKEVEPGFVGTMGDGIYETRCTDCNTMNLIFEINMGSGTWYIINEKKDEMACPLCGGVTGQNGICTNLRSCGKCKAPLVLVDGKLYRRKSAKEIKEQHRRKTS